MQISEFKQKYGDCNCKLDQIPAEFDWLMDKFLPLNPSRICEIGSWHGGTLYYWLRHSPNDAVVVSVDIDHGPLRRTIERSWPGLEERSKLHLVTGSSAEGGSPASVKKLMPEIDFLFVDGDHTRMGLLADLRTFGPMVRNGGVIAIHDINPLAIEAQEKGGHGVARVWSQVKKGAAGNSYTCDEIYLRKENVHLGSYGIGVIHVTAGFGGLVVTE